MAGDEGFEPSLFQVPNQENCSLGLPLDHSLPARLPIAPIAHIKRAFFPLDQIFLSSVDLQVY